MLYPFQVGRFTQVASLSPVAINYLTETEDLVARFTTPPTTTRKNHINTLITSLKTGATSGTDIWSKLDCFWMMAAADSQAARLNWKKHSGGSYGYDLINISGGTDPTFTADQGFSGWSSTKLLDTQFNLASPSLGSPNWTQNSACVGVYSRTNSSSANSYDIGNATFGNGIRFISSNSGNVSALGPNDSSLTSFGAVADSLGLHTVDRSSSTLRTAYRHGVAQGTTSSTASGAVLSEAPRIGGVSTLISTRELSCVFLGGSLNASEQLDIYNAIQTYMTALGKQV